MTAEWRNTRNILNTEYMEYSKTQNWLWMAVENECFLIFQLHTRPSRPRDARCIGGKMTCFTREPEVSSIFSTSSIAGTSLLIHSTDWSLTNFSTRFPHKFLNSLALNLTEMLIWKENDSVKYSDFPDQSQSLRFFACSLKTKTNYVIIGHGLSRERFIPAVRVLCKPHSYK